MGIRSLLNKHGVHMNITRHITYTIELKEPDVHDFLYLLKLVEEYMQEMRQGTMARPMTMGECNEILAIVGEYQEFFKN